MDGEQRHLKTKNNCQVRSYCKLASCWSTETSLKFRRAKNDRNVSKLQREVDYKFIKYRWARWWSWDLLPRVRKWSFDHVKRWTRTIIFVLFPVHWVNVRLEWWLRISYCSSAPDSHLAHPWQTGNVWTLCVALVGHLVTGGCTLLHVVFNLLDNRAAQWHPLSLPQERIGCTVLFGDWWLEALSLGLGRQLSWNQSSLVHYKYARTSSTETPYRKAELTLQSL